MMFQNCSSYKTRARSKSDIHNAQNLEIGQLEDEEALFHASAGSVPTNRLSIDLHRLCANFSTLYRLRTYSVPNLYRLCVDSVPTLYQFCTDSVRFSTHSVPNFFEVFTHRVLVGVKKVSTFQHIVLSVGQVDIEQANCFVLFFYFQSGSRISTKHGTDRNAFRSTTKSKSPEIIRKSTRQG